MTDMERLKKIIIESGVKKSFIAKKLGITRTALDKKLETGSDFKAFQMFILADILHLSDQETREIFFSQDVD